MGLVPFIASLDFIGFHIFNLGLFDTQYDVINDTYNHKDFNLEDEDHNKKKGPFVLRSVFEDRCEAFLDIGQIE